MSLDLSLVGRNYYDDKSKVNKYYTLFIYKNILGILSFLLKLLQFGTIFSSFKILKNKIIVIYEY